MEWLVVVEISATLFQPARSGSHLYPAPLHPVRSRTLSSRSYTPLVGLATPLLPCFPLCAFIIAHSWLFVKHFFFNCHLFFLSAFAYTPCCRGLEPCGSWMVESGCHPMEQDFLGEILQNSFVPLLQHIGLGLSRGFLNFFVRQGDFVLLHPTTHWGEVVRSCLPLDTLIIPHIGRFVKSYIFPRRYLTRTSGFLPR